MRRAPLIFLLAALAAPAISRSGSAEPRTAGSLGAPLWQKADPATRERAQEWLDRSATGWSPNRGQVANEAGQAATEVLYSTRAGDARVHVTTTGLSYYFVAREAEEESEHKPGGEKDEGPWTFEWARLDLKLEGAAIRPEAARARRAIAERGVENFYLPHCPGGVLDVPAYAEVEFPEIYPGIDWIVRGEPGGPAHQDFVVRPGGDPSSIRFTYVGATSVEIADGGQSLRIRTGLGEVREGALRCTQAGGSRVVGARFVRDGDAVTVRVDDYVRTEPLVIDPPLVWSTYFGGSIFDGSLTLYTDNVNQTFYAVGYTTSGNLPVFNGGGYYDGTYSTTVDGVIWKFSQLGVQQWTTYFGGNGTDLCKDATIDGLGNLYVVGLTGSSDLPIQVLGGAYNQASLDGPTDGFVARFDGLGALQWSTWIGGNSDESANGVCADPSGKVYICGQTSSIDFPLANPGGGAYYDNSYNLSDDAWVTRFSTLGAMEWSTYLGGTNTESALGVATGAGNLYVVGYTWSSNFPTVDPSGGAYYQPGLVDQQDAYIMRFTLPGVLTWATYLGGDDWDSASEPLVKSSGSVVVSGETRSSDFPTWDPGGGAYFDNSANGTFDLFLTEFTASAVPVWGTYFGGSGDETFGRPEAKGITLDAAGQLYMTAETFSPNFPIATPPGSYSDNSWNGSTDAVIMRFGTNRSLQWSTYFGTTATDFGTGIGVGVGGCVFATGESWETGSLFTVDPGLSALYDATNNGEDDVYFTRFCAPNSACCIDNNCQPASSQSQCFAMGGTAFYPSQPCSTTVCTILCTICGTKYHDLNRNGVQDGGEPGLTGWTIELRYPNGPIYATVVTGANGSYCFSAIPCGTWEVSEQHQPGWVQTSPNGAHTVTLGTGTTQNGVNFANYHCGSATPCIPSPTWLAAWWPMSDYPGSLSASDVAHPDPSRNVAQLHGGAVLDSATLCLGGPTQFASVDDADQYGIDFESGSFSIAAWIQASPGIPGERMVVEKRAMGVPPGSAHGWALYLDGLASRVQVSTGGAPETFPGPTVTADTWTHLAVTLDRASGQGRWYLDGAPAPAFDFTPPAGDVNSDAELLIGGSSSQTGSEPGFNGCIGDLALFAAPLSAADVNKAWIPGPFGFCPEYAAIPAVTTICQGQTSRQVCFTICNNNATAQTYQWSLAGLTAGPGCNVAGPTQFSPSAGSVVVPAGGCSAPICVTIQRPLGFTAHNATACFALTFINTQTGRCQTRTSKLRADNSCWCATPPPSPVNVAARVPAGTLIGIPIDLPCDPVARLAYQVRAEWLDPEHADPVSLSLNGLPPGMPVTGELDGSSGVPPTLEVVARYPNGHDPAALYEIVLEADTDGDGTRERLGGIVVRSTYEAVPSTGVSDETATDSSPRLRASPNPFFSRANVELVLARAGAIEIGIFDLSGRLVRSLARGRFEPGPRTFVWDGRDDDGRRAAAGIYFVRCLGAGRSLEAKLVKLH